MATASGLSLQTGMKSVQAGTYVAEQRARAVYDLVAPASNASGAKIPKQQSQSRKRGKGYPTHEPTMLPALMSLEPLLAGKSGRPDSTSASLPPILAGTDKTARYAFCNPADDAFNQWLMPPRGTSSKWMSSTQSYSTSPSVGEDDDLPPVPDYLWHVLLLDKTFDVASNTIHHVSDCLCLELGLDEGTAFQIVEAVVRKKVAKLATFDSQKEAYRKMEMLLDYGLVVRISKGVASLKDDPPNVSKRKYTEVFNKQKLLGRRDKVSPKLPLMMCAASMSTSYAWRKKREPILVISEDPVGDWFSSEQKRCVEGSGDAEGNLPQQGDEDDTLKEQATNKASVLRQVINKHRKTLNIDDGKTNMSVSDVLGLLGFREDGSKKREIAVPLETSTREHKMLDTDMKEACKMLRIFVFGRVGNEGATNIRERNKIFYEPIGLKEEVLELYGLWKKLDVDQSGRVDIGEFRVFGEQHMKEQMQQRSDGGEIIEAQVSVSSHPTPRQLAAGVGDHKTFVTKLCDKLALLLLGKKSSFVIEDMMKVLWPCAELSDLKMMKTWCKDFAAQATKTRVQTPPILPEEELDGLTSVFSHFDEDGSGGVSIDELVGKGLIYEDQVESYIAEWGKSEELTVLQFCEMMCPAGFRAHTKAKTAILQNGSRIYFDPRVNAWREEGSDDNSLQPDSAVT